MAEDEHDIWFTVLCLASIAILCVGVGGLLFIYFHIPRPSEYQTLPLLVEASLYFAFIVIGLLLVIGIYQGRKWVRYLVGILLAGLLASEIIALITYRTLVVGIINILATVFLSAFILSILTRPSMKAHFSK